MNICISVCAKTADEFIEKIKLAAEKADIVELRFDCLEESEIENVWGNFPQLQKRFRGKLLATFRPQEQGGERKMTFQTREEFWIYSHVFEFVNWADLESDFSVEKIDNLWGKAFEKVVKSFHNFKDIPENLGEIYENLVSQNPDVVKIAVQANDICDTIPVWKLLERAKADNKEIIPIAMGEAGKWTRILGLAHGAFLTFAALDEESATAPGQITIEDMVGVYRVKELDESTEIYGILGNNTATSMSPYLHNAAFNFHGLNAVFVPLQTENLADFMRRMVKPETREIALNFKGFAVTIPHKQAIINYLDSIDETAKKIGAVNTVKIDESGKLHGFNTDAAGFIEPLKNSYGNLTNVNVAIIGAGGAARACLYALKKEGANVTIFARNLEKARVLADEFAVEAKELTSNHSTFTTFEILVNATPLGMKGKFEGETPVTAAQMEGVNLVYDLVYNPFETRFLQEADKVFIPKIGGLAMLVAQAMAQQKFWTGKDAPMKEMSAAALKKLR